MARIVLTKQGSFDADLMNAINAMFAELYAVPAGVGSSLASGNIIVGSAGNLGASVAMSGDVTISNTGVTAIKASVGLTTPDIGVATGTSVVLSGNCRAASFNAGATAGVSAGPFTTVASIRTIGGIVTTLTGS